MDKKCTKFENDNIYMKYTLITIKLNYQTFQILTKYTLFLIKIIWSKNRYDSFVTIIAPNFKAV